MYMWILLLLLSVFGPTGAGAASPVETEMSKSQETAHPPTTITAKKMTVRNQDSQAVFEGSVVLTQGTLLVYSDKMVVSFVPKGDEPKQGAGTEGKKSEAGTSGGNGKSGDMLPGTSGRSVKQIEAIGHVRIEKESGNATSNKAVFDNSRRIVTLTGDPVAWEKGTRVSGDKIIIYLDEDRSVVEGGTRLRIDGESGAVR